MVDGWRTSVRRNVVRWCGYEGERTKGGDDEQEEVEEEGGGGGWKVGAGLRVSTRGGGRRQSG